MRVDVRGGLVVGVAHDLHGDQRVDAALVEQRYVVVPEIVRGQRGLDLLEDVVRAGGARRDLALFHAFLTGVGDSISGFYKVFYEAVI